jgi:hypothetical protein
MADEKFKPVKETGKGVKTGNRHNSIIPKNNPKYSPIQIFLKVARERFELSSEAPEAPILDR